jgi:hypothetical protein
MKIAHIGLPKTASTFLQKHYFSKLPFCFYSTQPPYTWPVEFRFIWTTHLFWYDDLLNKNALKLRDERIHDFRVAVSKELGGWKKGVRCWARTIERESILLSAEGLCGLSVEITHVHMELLRCAGVEKALFVIRRQDEYALSLWRQLILREDRFSRFVKFATLFGCDNDHPIVELDWSRYVEALHAVFGRENVLVLPYEMMIEARDLFLCRFEYFAELEHGQARPDMGCGENLSSRDETYRGYVMDDWLVFDRVPFLRRAWRRLARSIPFIKDMGSIIHEIGVSDSMHDFLLTRYRDSNARLQEQIDVDLRDYGYL